jgi:pimeloyl-ACP methyl ester carboxylesterase
LGILKQAGMARRLNSMIAILLLIPLGYVAICALLYLRQDQMVFFPSRAPAEALDLAAAAEGFEPWLTKEGRRIGWKSRDGDPKNVLLIFHGNAGLALRRAYYREYLKDQGSDWKTYLLEYPGYGAREGAPSEKALTEAALEALDTLAVSSPQPTIRILGESLGSGVASAVAGARPGHVASVILVTPYDSLVNAAQSHYPWLPVGWLLRTRFDSSSHLKSYPGPVAFLVGEGDPTVPTHLGLRLFEDYHGQKKLWLVPEAGHDVSEFIRTDWPQVAEFLEGSR